MMKNKITAVTLMLLTASVLTACGEKENDITAPSTAPKPTVESATRTDSSVEVKQDDAKDENAVHKFGESSKLGEDLEITVQAPEEFKPGEFVFDADEETAKLPAVKMQITIKNTGAKSLDINGFEFNSTMSSGGKVTDARLIDPENGVAMPKTQFTLDPDTSYDYVVAYRVLDPKAITYRLQYMHDPIEEPVQVVFSNK